MNRFLSLMIPLIFVAGLFVQSNAQEEPVKRKHTLTHHMSPEEKADFHTVGKGFLETDPPPGVIHNIAEFEKMEGVLVGYPGNFGISYELIAAMSEEIPVTSIVENNNQLNYVTNQYQSNGVNMANTNFLVTALDSYWTRDYGPWYIRYGDDQIGIMDFIYNRPNRPNDNAVPPQMAEYLGIESFAMDFITAGGNYMTDGYGISSSSDLCWEENPSLTPAEIDQMLLEYCGIETYHVLPDPNNTYIDHIDCWGKFLDVDKVLIREVPISHPQYDEIEATANYYANEISAWGNNFEVYRVWTPNNEPYTNSLILNDRVFLPIMGGQWDDEAVAAYEAAMPGYEILTFTGSWESTDALHCRTKGIADRNTLYIEHYPLLGDQPVQPDYEIEATIAAISGEKYIR
ncbi:MAG: agmatine deiminase family protein [Bacteroidales bacterium]